MFAQLTPISRGEPSPRTVGIACEYRAMSVVTPSWKLAYFPEQDEGRLWDRIADPEEQHDLWAVTAVENPARGSRLDWTPGLRIQFLRLRLSGT